MACGRFGAVREPFERGVRRAGDEHRVLAGEHRNGADERPGGGLLEQVGEDDHERALLALGAPEGLLVVAVDRGRLEVEERADDRLAALAGGRERVADLGVERHRAGAVAELVGDERERGGGVEGGVEDRRVVQRRGGQAAGVDQQQQVAVLLEPVVVAHRAPEPRGRPPVDLADVVVGLVVADQLELGAQAERSAGGRALLAEAAAGPRRARAVARCAGRGRPGRRGSRSPDGPSGRASAARSRAWRPPGACGARGARRRRSRRAAASPSLGCTTSAAGAAWRTRTVPPAGGSAAISSLVGTPRESTSGTVRLTSGRRLAARASTATAATSATASRIGTPTGRTSTSSAITPSTTARAQDSWAGRARENRPWAIAPSETSPRGEASPLIAAPGRPRGRRGWLRSAWRVRVRPPG